MHIVLEFSAKHNAFITSNIVIYCVMVVTKKIQNCSEMNGVNGKNQSSECQAC